MERRRVRTLLLALGVVVVAAEAVAFALALDGYSTFYAVDQWAFLGTLAYVVAVVGFTVRSRTTGSPT